MNNSLSLRFDTDGSRKTKTKEKNNGCRFLKMTSDLTNCVCIDTQFKPELVFLFFGGGRGEKGTMKTFDSPPLHPCVCVRTCRDEKKIKKQEAK